MNKLDKDYLALLQDILDYGVKKQTRNGEVLSVFGRTIRHSMKDGFPLLTTKKMAFKTMVTELLWFLRGDTSIKYLVDNNCHIWDGDALKAYHKHEMNEFKKLKEKYPNRRYKFALTTQEEFINKIKTDDEFAKKWGELGKIYGYQWRRWTNYTGDEINEGTYEMTNEPIDQISELIKQLKDNPDSRRLLISAWNPAEVDDCVLPPCHYGFQVYTRELSWKERWEHYFYNVSNERCLSETELDKINYPKRAISLMFNMRSNDVPLGLPFNLASYGLLLSILGEIVNMVPDELIANLGDAHIYLNQIDGVTEQLKRNSFDLPTLRINTEFWPTKSEECGIGELTDNINFLIKEMRIDDFQIENYKSHPSIKMPLSN